jgi:hypothetical protein
MKAVLSSLPSSVLLASLAAGVVLAGCQVYDFEPVIPGAEAQETRSVPLAFNQPKPNLMLLVDKSGSMADPVSPSGGPSKIVVLQQVMGEFLVPTPGVGATVARVGLAQFPDQSCVPTAASDVLSALPPASAGDADAVLEAASSAANVALQALTPSGGTPTQASLQYVAGNIAELSDPSRQDFVLLLTDGLPNCNNSLNAQTCTCTSTASGLPPCVANTDCLDKDATVAQIESMKTTQNIKTIVIGFGADVLGSIPQNTLEAMAEAGGFVRKCPNTNGDCGPGNACVLATGLCSEQFFQATDGVTLTAALAEIGSTLTQTACIYNLDEVPSDPSLISVVLNGTPYLPGADTWTYDATKNQIVFQGALCARLKNNTPQNPITLDIRLLQIIN